MKTFSTFRFASAVIPNRIRCDFQRGKHDWAAGNSLRSPPTGAPCAACHRRRARHDSQGTAPARITSPTRLSALVERLSSC